MVLSANGFGTVWQCLDMDLVSFGAAVTVVDRKTRRDKSESATTAWVAAQGTPDMLQEWTMHWSDGVASGKVDPRKAAANQRLLNKLPRVLKRA